MYYIMLEGRKHGNPGSMYFQNGIDRGFNFKALRGFLKYKVH